MEFRNLKKQYQVLKPKIDAAVQTVMAAGNFISGKQVNELEDKLAEYVGVKHCVTCANGTDALSLVLMAWGVGKGDAVFVPSFTFFASAEVVAFEGATPIFVDVDPHTFNIDPLKLEEEICRIKAQGNYTPRAIIAVDLFGLPANYPALEEIARKHDLLLLEDGAQGFGGAISGKKACAFGHAATTSFFPAKPLGCYGDGGAIFTDDDALAAYVKSVKFHGKGSDKYDNVQIGVNSRLDTLQAAILIEKLKAFTEYELAAVNRAYELYTQKLDSIVKTPVIPQGYYSSFAQYTIVLESKQQRDALQERLKSCGIPSMVYYPKPMHLQTAFADMQLKPGRFPVAKMLCDCVLSLPMHPYLENEEIDLVAETICKFLS